MNRAKKHTIGPITQPRHGIIRNTRIPAVKTSRAKAIPETLLCEYMVA
jgi:hypothetical protein